MDAQKKVIKNSLGNVTILEAAELELKALHTRLAVLNENLKKIAYSNTTRQMYDPRTRLTRLLLIPVITHFNRLSILTDAPIFSACFGIRRCLHDFGIDPRSGIIFTVSR
jgi:hypothetical protein